MWGWGISKLTFACNKINLKNEKKLSGDFKNTW